MIAETFLDIKDRSHEAGESDFPMALKTYPIGGDPSKTRLDMSGEKPGVVEDEGMETGRQHGGSTTALIGGGLSLQAHTFAEHTSGLVGRLPEYTKKMLGLGGGGRQDHFV